MEKKLRLGIIGVGNMGTAHGKNVLEGKCPDFVLSALCDTDGRRLEGWGVPGFQSPQALLDSGLVDACIIATPHYDHPALAMACMERGIHVLMEKPAGVYTAQVRKMNALAAKCDTVFAMMFNQRMNPLYRKMRELVRSGKYGAIRRTNWIITNWYRSQAYYDSGAWRATWAGEGGGVLLNQCPHQLDLWQWICGMPVRVSAHMHMGKWHDIEVEDDVTAYVEYENGATGVFITSTGDACGTNRFEIQMDGAKLVAEDGRLTVTELSVPEPEFSRTNTVPFGKPESRSFEPELVGENTGHVGVINGFGGAILRGEPLVAGGEEGILGLTLSNAMHLSAFLGRPVELPLDEDLYYDCLSRRVAGSRHKSTPSILADTAETY